MSIVESNDGVSEADKRRVTRTQSIVDGLGIDARVIWHDVRGATTADAYASLGVTAGDIAKSILFIAKDGSAHMVIIAGDRRVDTKKLKKLVGREVRIARPEEVLLHTGTEVGGVSPLGCDAVPKYVDRSVLAKEWMHASAGSAYATLKIRTKDLIACTRGNVVDVAE
ncbi:MAG: YbaK/EbsC family protein [Candidatus Aenigmarchaeota archaeon]|nr:YbaK/EbsC family protein [Candidatus Aenigmarchaeota archaeon]